MLVAANFCPESSEVAKHVGQGTFLIQKKHVLYHLLQPPTSLSPLRTSHHLFHV